MLHTMKNPVVVMISGAPATGKTHLALLLAGSLHVVVFQKDAIKETLFDTLGQDDREWSRMLGTAAFALLRALVEAHLKARQSVIVEANFQRRYEGPWVANMKERYDAHVVELHCHADMETVLARIARRDGTDERHSGHGPGDVAVRELRDSYQHYGPVTEGDEVVLIDTTDFAAVDYAAIVERVRSSIALSG